MTEISNFIDFMRDKGCGPSSSSDIKPTDKWVDYQIDGDSHGKKKGYYTLKIDGEYISGACGDRRNGETYQFWGKPDRKLTDEERREYAKKRAAEKKQKEEEVKKRQENAAKKALERWEKAKKSSHQYLVKKGISGSSTRVLGDILLIPMRDSDKKLWGVQSIDKDGGKLFQSGGRKKGCYATIVYKGANTDTIYIAEGYATAETISNAMGCISLAAFDAGNIIHVAKDIRKKFPNSKIIIAADNDHSKEKNAGLDAARETCSAINAIMVYPENIQGSDWNDMQAELGIDAVRDSVNAQLADGGRMKSSVVVDDSPSPTFNQEPPTEWLESLPPMEAYDDEARVQVSMYKGGGQTSEYDPNWKEKLHYNDEGKLTAKSLNNVMLILENSPKFRDMFCYDEFAHEKILVQCPDWEKPETFRPRPITDEDNTWLAMSLEKHGLTLEMNKIKKILDAIIVKKRRNPAREYFNTLQWDGVKRLDNWLTYYAGCEKEDHEYVSKVGKKWLVAAVGRVFEPGKKFDHMLVLEGAQGKGKSTMLRELASIRGKAYFDDTIKVSDLGNDKTVPKLQGVLIIELAEMAGMRKAAIEELKQQITLQEDRIVLKYKNEASRFPRQFVYAGTINPTDGYLDDPTGNRRFWPVTCGNNIDIESIRRDKEQLWAEAVNEYRNGYQTWMDEDMIKLHAEVVGSREIVSPWMPNIESLCRGRLFVSNDEIWSTLNVEVSKRTHKDLREIGKIMSSLGYSQTRKRQNGSREYGWMKAA